MNQICFSVTIKGHLKTSVSIVACLVVINHPWMTCTFDMPFLSSTAPPASWTNKIYFSYWKAEWLTVMLFSITGTTEVFSFIASSGIRLLCFFVNIARSLISAAKHFREKQQDTRKRRRPKCGEKKKKKKRQTCADRHEIQRRSKKEDGCRWVGGR